MNFYHVRDCDANTNVLQLSGPITFVRTIADRLKWARERRGLSQEQVATAAGVRQGTIGNIESGVRKRPRELLAIAAAVGVDAEWLLSGKAPMHPYQTTTAKPPMFSGAFSNGEPSPNIHGQVPVISWVQAGPWAESCDLLELGVVERWLLCPVPHSRCTAALRVRGDSMTAPIGAPRSYPDGCYIFVDFDKRSPINGQRIIARLDDSDEATFKIYKDEDLRRWLMPLNPMYPPIFDKFIALGTVIGKWEDE